MNKKDYYQILEINRNVTQEEIKKSYRRLALRYHPDRNQGGKEAEDRFKEIGEAYAVLGDQEKRGVYDQFGHRQFRQSYRPEDIFENFNSGDFFREFSSRFEGDISRRFFCGRGGFGCGRRKAGFFRKRHLRGYFANFGRRELYQDGSLTCELPLTISEALLGTEKEILFKRGGGTERVTIRIPPGIENDTLLSLSLKGSEGSYRENKFYLRVKVVND